VDAMGKPKRLPLEGEAQWQRINRFPGWPFGETLRERPVCGRATWTWEVRANDDRAATARVGMWRPLLYERSNLRRRGMVGKREVERH
jgi:hypothetical protein